MTKGTLNPTPAPRQDPEMDNYIYGGGPPKQRGWDWVDWVFALAIVLGIAIPVIALIEVVVR